MGLEMCGARLHEAINFVIAVATDQIAILCTACASHGFENFVYLN